MSKRLQVLMDERELREIERLARGERVTVSEWARQALRVAAGRRPRGDARRKIEVVRAAARQAFPAGDIAQMLEEIERGYGVQRDP